jgi:hypothetical protein
MRADLQRLKRDTDTSRTAQHSLPEEVIGASAPVPASQQTRTSNSSRAPSPLVVPAQTKKHFARDWRFLVLATLLLVAIVTAALCWRSSKTLALTEKDTILLSDFVNTTGDPVFDDALKQALAVSLQQSPFLNLVSNEQVQETLRYMSRPPNTPMTQDVTREVSNAFNRKPC